MFDTALIVIDLQRDYFPDGKFVLPGIERTVFWLTRAYERSERGK